MRYFIYTLIALIIVQPARPFSWGGQDHPDRANPLSASDSNKLRVLPGSPINSGGSALLPLGTFGPLASVSLEHAGDYWVAPGNAVNLTYNGLSRLELWQHNSQGWYLSQYIVVDQNGQPLAQMNAWSQDSQNRSRTRADIAWTMVAHFAQRAVVFTRSVPAPATQVLLNQVPITFQWASTGTGINGSNLIQSLITNGTYASNGFNIAVSIAGSDIGYYAQTDSDSSATSSYTTTYSDYCTVNGVSTLLSTASISVTPTTSSLITGPTTYNGDPFGMPAYSYSINNIYPQARVVMVLQRPDGTSPVIWDSADVGSAAATGSSNISSSLFLYSYINQFGTYKIRVFQKAPIFQTSVAVPSEVSALTTTIPGNWEELSGINSITITNNVAVNANITTL